jgi:hypothetical protein
MESEREPGFSAEGAVVEILERGGERFAKIVIAPGTVLEVPAGAVDVTLGDRVTVDASLNVRQVRGRPEALRGDAAAIEPAAEAPGGLRTSSEKPRFEDYQHVLRIAGVFLLGIVIFLAWRAWLIPDDYGVYGHYRAGAIADAADKPLHFAGRLACVSCHDDVQQVTAKGSHTAIGCEACHGPLGQHARAEVDLAPIRPSPRGVCLTCHTARVGMPAAFPQVVVNDHSEAGPCTECHTAHAPGLM